MADRVRVVAWHRWGYTVWLTRFGADGRPFWGTRTDAAVYSDAAKAREARDACKERESVDDCIVVVKVRPSLPIGNAKEQP